MSVSEFMNEVMKRSGGDLSAALVNLSGSLRSHRFAD